MNNLNKFEPVPDDAKMICPSCHHQNDPNVNFCRSCGAPIGTGATLGPYEQTLSQGFMLRQATQGAPKLIIVIGIWILFGPVAIAFGIISTQMIMDILAEPSRMQLSFLPFFVILVFAVVILFKTTDNYIVKMRAIRKNKDV